MHPENIQSKPFLDIGASVIVMPVSDIQFSLMRIQSQFHTYLPAIWKIKISYVLNIISCVIF